MAVVAAQKPLRQAVVARGAAAHSEAEEHYHRVHLDLVRAGAVRVVAVCLVVVANSHQDEQGATRRRVRTV